MYLWRCLLAVTLGLLWYFSDLAQVTVQSALCIFCLLLSPRLFRTTDRESSTQTDELVEDPPLQDTSQDEHVHREDETDATSVESSQNLQYSSVRKSLHQVFECAYTHLITPWYTAPEPTDSQPLHGALLKEVDLFVDKTIGHTKDFDLCAASVGCIRILTQHLHNAKHSESGSPVFSSRADEMAVLRVISEVLVRNLLPESLWGLDLCHCLLKEIVAVKVLDLLVTWFSDPDNLNQLVVSKLDVVSTKTTVEELGERGATPTSLESEESGRLTDDPEECKTSETKAKKKAGSRFKEGLSKFLDKVKSKKTKNRKMKKKEQICFAPALMSPALLEDDENASSREGSINSLLDSENEDSDADSYTTTAQEDIEFNLTYEVWRAGNWAVRVINVKRENEELSFTVHLEEKDNPENLQWDVRKTQTDILHFHSMWEDTSSFPSISVIIENPDRPMDDDFEEEAKATLENFLQALVSDAEIGHSLVVFQFLCPLDWLLGEEEHSGGVWSLLSGLAYLLTPAQEEEEPSSQKEEAKPDDMLTSCGDAQPTVQPALINDPQVPGESDLGEASPACAPSDTEPTDNSRGVDPASLPVLQGKVEDSTGQPVQEPGMISVGLSSVTEGEDTENISGSPCIQSGVWSNKKDELRNKEKEKQRLAKEETQRQPQLQKKDLNQSNWEKSEITKALLDLLKEISGNSFILRVFDSLLKAVMPLVKKKVNSFMKKMNPTEAQVASYIDTFCENQWPKGSPETPRPPRSDEEKNETKHRAHQLILAKCSSFVIKKTEIETVFKIFQDTEENKKLVYMLLSFLLREFLPGEPALNVIANVTVKDIV